MKRNFEDIEHNDVFPSETRLRRHLTLKYCDGNGVDIGSGGCPITPWAVQIENHHNYHCKDSKIANDINYFGDAIDIPFKNETLDFVYSSHVLEDFLDWKPILDEWNRVLKSGGYIIIMVPDHIIFRQRVANGDNTDNPSHKHESYAGELTKFYKKNYTNFSIVCDYVTDSYNILFVAKKL